MSISLLPAAGCVAMTQPADSSALTLVSVYVYTSCLTRTAPFLTEPNTLLSSAEVDHQHFDIFASLPLKCPKS